MSAFPPPPPPPPPGQQPAQPQPVTAQPATHQPYQQTGVPQQPVEQAQKSRKNNFTLKWLGIGAGIGFILSFILLAAFHNISSQPAHLPFGAKHAYYKALEKCNIEGDHPGVTNKQGELSLVYYSSDDDKEVDDSRIRCVMSALEPGAHQQIRDLDSEGIDIGKKYRFHFTSENDDTIFLVTKQ